MNERPPQPSDGTEEAPEEALDWFLRLQDPELPPSRRRDFIAWRSADPARGEAFDRVAGLWASPEFAAAVAAHAPPARRERPRWLRSAVALAASVVLLLGLAQLGGLLVPLSADYATRIGEREEILLTDGTRLTLNSGSAVDIEFDAGRRGVRLLRGEAFFDVTPNPERPFEVVSDHASVRVVGTAFAVRDGDEADRVTVERGEVAVSGRDGTGTVHLLPGQAVAVTADGPLALEKAAPDSELAWLEGRFRFDQQPLGEVIAELRRYHAGLILLRDPGLAAVAVTGDYRLDDTAAIAASLAAAVGARLTDLGGGVLVIE